MARRLTTSTYTRTVLTRVDSPEYDAIQASKPMPSAQVIKCWHEAYKRQQEQTREPYPTA